MNKSIVNSHLTDEEIWEMLKPKMEKLGIDSNGSGSVLKTESGLLTKTICKNFMYLDDVIRLVTTVYRSGYGRGQKGRPFKIGEKKKGHWEWIKSNEIVLDGIKVRYMKRTEYDDGNNPYYPKIGQECIKLNAPGWPDTDFWVQFDGSNYKFTCMNSCQDCFQKWVEE